MTTAREIAVPGRYRDGVTSIRAPVSSVGFSRLAFQLLPDDPRRSDILLFTGNVLIYGEE